MRRLTKYEREILKSLEKDLNFREKVILRLFKKFSFKVLQKSVRDRIFKD